MNYFTMEDDQDLIYVNMDGQQISIDLEVFNQNSNAIISAKNNDDDNKNSTMEQNFDEENEDIDLISMIKNMVLEEKLRDKNTIRQYHDENTFLRNEISEKTIQLSHYSNC